MAGDLLDPLSAAGIAEAAVGRSLDAARRADNSALVSVSAAATAGAMRDAVAALLAAIGLPVRWVNDTALQIRLPDGSWTSPVDLRGPVGGPGAIPKIGVGTVTEGEFAVIRDPASPDAAPLLDFVLARGPAAWTPVPAAASDGARRVLRIVDWTGGQGDKPATNLYVGAAGLVADLASAFDFRGAPGAGGTVVHTGAPSPGDLAVFGSDGDHIGSGGTLTALGASLAAAATAAAAKQILALAVGDVAGAAPLASPAFSGAPTAPQAPQGDSSTKLATTAFVQAALAALINAAPAALDTLGEIAAQLANDESAASALATAVAGKLAKASNLSDLADVAASRTNLGLKIGANVQAWDSDLDAIAALTTTGFGRSLLTQASAAAVKTLLSVVSADIGDATTLGKALLAIASAAALTAQVNAVVGDTGSGGTKGLVPAPAAGDAAAGKYLRADGAWAAPASSFPVSGIAVKTAAYTIAVADKGTLFDLTGSFPLTLPAVSGASALAPLYFHWRKRDGAGVCTIACAGSDTFRDGTTSMALYQEDATLVSFGGPWFAPPGGRQRGWVRLGSAAVATAVASVLFSAGFADPALDKLQFEADGVTFASSDNLLARLSKGGVVQTSGYTGTYGVFTGSSANATPMPAGFGVSTYSANNMSLTLTNPSLSDPSRQRATFSIYPSSNNVSAFGAGQQTTAGTPQSLTFVGSGGQNVTGGLFTASGYRP